MNNHVKKQFLEWQESTTSRKDEIGHHLQECEECRLYYEKMKNLLDPRLISGFPVLRPDPFLPTRIQALVAENKRTNARELFAIARLSLQGLALIFALVIGIVLGKAISVQPMNNKTNELVSVYHNAISQEDFSSQMELILDPLEGDPQ
jgi:predicted anti-sigma-YlaC factor YlaD